MDQIVPAIACRAVRLVPAHARLAGTAAVHIQLPIPVHIRGRGRGPLSALEDKHGQEHVQDQCRDQDRGRHHGEHRRRSAHRHLRVSTSHHHLRRRRRPSPAVAPFSLIPRTFPIFHLHRRLCHSRRALAGLVLILRQPQSRIRSCSIGPVGHNSIRLHHRLHPGHRLACLVRSVLAVMGMADMSMEVVMVLGMGAVLVIIRVVAMAVVMVDMDTKIAGIIFTADGDGGFEVGDREDSKVCFGSRMHVILLDI